MTSQTLHNCQIANAIQRIDDHMLLSSETKSWYELSRESSPDSQHKRRNTIIAELLSARLHEVLRDKFGVGEENEPGNIIIRTCPGSGAYVMYGRSYKCGVCGQTGEVIDSSVPLHFQEVVKV